MTSIPGTESLPPWAQLLAIIIFVITTAILAAVSQSRGRKSAERERREDQATATQTAGAMLAVGPTADRLTMDTLVTTLAEIKQVLHRINDRMDEQEREKREEEKDELRDLRAEVKEMRRGLVAQGVTSRVRE